MRTVILLSAVVLAGCNDSSSGPESAAVPLPHDGQGHSSEGERPIEFVGSTTCAECHSEQHESYLRTAHSRSLSLVEPDSEPTDGGFLHELSGRTYEVYREDGLLRHREALAGGDGESIVESDYPVKYLVGSGNHTRTYLSEIDGFLVESPITWYESRREWDVSPGYDVPFPLGFERAADVACLFCHVGSAEQLDGSQHRIRFHELAIGCERCHGPGHEHVAAAESHRPREEVTASIANPAKLSRALTEDICAQCHLRGDATAFLPGKDPMDFRPGTPLTSVRIDYFVNTRNDQMEVVGHVEQMRLSRCFTQSDELTCITCHDMHTGETGSSTHQIYRSRCLDCHTVAGCGLPEGDAGRAAAEDDCVTCHMPQTATDIPHIAFTHHRIGIHADEEGTSAPNTDAAELVSIADISRLSNWVKDRSLGMAYLEFLERTNDSRVRRLRQQRSLELLERASRDGQMDGDVWAAIARLYWEVNPGLAIDTANTALSQADVSPKARINANFVLADMHYQREEWEQALTPLEELITLRRHSEDWLLLGIVRHILGREDGVRTLEAALEINPFRDDALEALGEVLQREGRAGDAASSRQRAALLRSLQPQSAE